MLFPIILLILILAALVVAYFAAKTWHWAHVLVVMALFFSTIGFLILGAETLRIHAVYGSQIKRTEEELKRVEPKIDALEHGTRNLQVIQQLVADELEVSEEAEEMAPLGDLNHKMHLEVRRRGRVWRGATPAGTLDPDSSAINVAVPLPTPHGIAPNSILFAFEEGPANTDEPRQGKQYLGEFRVTAAGAQQVTLVPVLQMSESDFEWQRLAGSSGPWALYEQMPSDRYELFANHSEEQLRKLLPAYSVDDYVRHGKEAGPDDDVWHRVGYDADGNRLSPDNIDKAVSFRYERDLRDYDYYFHELARERVILEADKAAVAEDVKKLEAALASARQLQAFREDQLQMLNRDLAGVKKELATIEKLLAIVESQLAKGKEKLVFTLAENDRLAKQLADLQAQMIRQIDERLGGAPAEAAAL